MAGSAETCLIIIVTQHVFTCQVTLTASPSLATGVFHTTYTYLNTLVDGEVPLVLTSRRTVSNTVTAPEALLQPSKPAGHDTNTYLNTG